MTLEEAVSELVLGDVNRWPVLTRSDLRVIFPTGSTSAFAAGLRRLCKIGLLEPVMRGLYYNHTSENKTAKGTLGNLIQAMRPGHLVYVSHEGLLAAHSIISQQVFCGTYATTGASGEYTTPFGRIFFHQTRRTRPDIWRRTLYDRTSRLRYAHPETAIEDLQRRFRGNAPFEFDMDILRDVAEEWEGNEHNQ